MYSQRREYYTSEVRFLLSIQYTRKTCYARMLVTEPGCFSKVKQACIGAPLQSSQRRVMLARSTGASTTVSMRPETGLIVQVHLGMLQMPSAPQGIQWDGCHHMELCDFIMRLGMLPARSALMPILNIWPLLCHSGHSLGVQTKTFQVLYSTALSMLHTNVLTVQRR